MSTIACCITVHEQTESKSTVIDLQWLEHLWDHGNLFETRVVRVTEGQSSCQVRKQMAMI